MKAAAPRLQGKVAIVTGAGCVGPGWGNGRAIAVRFAEEGAKVFAVDRDPAAMDETLALIREAGGEATPYAADVTDSNAIAGLVAACVDAYGGIDILVNNVGGPAPGGPVALSEQDWARQLDINLTSVFLMCKHVMPLMEKKGAGAIVNIASTSGIRFTGAPAVGYAAAKAGVIQFGGGVGVEYA
ncbi:MAG: SDR family NAD(P)-dependent oxidoreductase, partial [Microbacteriaceae bacterium]|nr:SDR family NAD(P)-dependent oxidoreductase [Burkholderiaceae bacterium]